MSAGLDIGTKSLKVVQLEKSGQGFALKTSGIMGFPNEGIEKIADASEEARMVDSILRLFKAANITEKEVAVSLPEQLVFTRTVSLPPLTDQEIAAAIKWEAEQYIPIPAKEAIIQHQILERREDGPNPEVVVLLVAAPRNLVERYVGLLEKARLNVTAVETELLALTRALAPANQLATLIDFGARSLNLAISKNSELVFSRSVPLAGDALTRALTQSLGVKPQEAEEYKRAYGLSSNQLEGRIKASLEPLLKSIVDEIKKAVHFYQTEEKGEAPALTIVSGGVANMPDLISYFSKSVSGEVSIANGFAKVKVDQNIWAHVAPYSPLYAIAVGLAMR